jgi:soluble lytic murein transglycosylase-like protein
MLNLLNKNKLRAFTCYSKPRSSLRIALVVTSSLATLIAMPNWLRGLESIHHPRTTSREITLVPEHLPSETDPAVVAKQKERIAHQALADSLGKRYRVSKEALERFIHLAYSAGQMTKVDPLLILAVMAVESSFNPIAESVMGAKGLMQIIPEFHQDKLVGTPGIPLNALDPEINILAGARVLREYATRSGEDLVAALRLYGGTGPDPANPYPAKVLSERERLEQVLRRVFDRREVRAAGGVPNT